MSAGRLAARMGGRATSLVAALAFAVLCVTLAALAPWKGGQSVSEDAAAPEEPAPLRGRWIASVFGESAASAAPVRHRTVWVKGAGYDAMDDNDLRGMLDGTFRWGWNQPHQVHVRIGRRGQRPSYGEHELFRVLQLWDGLELPPASRVTEASLELEVENGPDRPLRVFLYEVRKPWNPGEGGERLDNVSPPRPGEVWWNEAAAGVRSWGLPGAGFASDTSLDADTAVMPLASALYRPHEGTLVFRSQELAAYVGAQIEARAPLRFLLKLSDYEEDQPGGVIEVYSAEHGDSHEIGRRPRLSVEWESRSVRASVERRMTLEYGRSLDPVALPTRGASWLAVSFFPEEESATPASSLRLLDPKGKETRLDLAPGRVLKLAPETERVELEWIGATAPLPLGDPFVTELRDTWVRTGPRETQDVRFEFTSPTGRSHVRSAAYVGDHRWRVEFVPDELGRWRYHFAHKLADEAGFRSGEGQIDVIASAGVDAQLDALALRLESQEPKKSRSVWARIQLARLERAALQRMSPDEFRAEPGAALRKRLARVRAALGERAPDPLPLVPDPVAVLDPVQGPLPDPEPLPAPDLVEPVHVRGARFVAGDQAHYPTTDGALPEEPQLATHGYLADRDGFADERRRRVRRGLRLHGYDAIFLDLLHTGGEGASISPYQDALDGPLDVERMEQWRFELRRLVREGIRPVLWLFAGDLESARDASDATLERHVREMVRWFDDLPVLWVLGLELEGWPRERVDRIGRILAQSAHNPVGVDQSAVQREYLDAEWAAFAVYRYAAPGAHGSGPGWERVYRETLEVRALMGAKALIAVDYADANGGEHEARGLAAAFALAAGLGNGAPRGLARLIESLPPDVAASRDGASLVLSGSKARAEADANTVTFHCVRCASDDQLRAAQVN